MFKIALTFVAACFAGSAFSAESARPLRALMVCGGCCHDYTHQKTIIADGVRARANVEFTVVHEGGDAREHKVSIYEKPEWWKGYDVVVHNECFGMVDDDAFINGIAAAHKAGLAAVMLHCSSHSYRAGKTEEWRKALGITSSSHEKRRDLEIVNAKPEHPIMKGLPAKWNNPDDELYKNEKVWPNVIPLAKSYGVETKKDHVVVWLNTYEKGRVFATTLGHMNSTMQSDWYLDLVTRGLLWACDNLDENGRPKSGYAAAK